MPWRRGETDPEARLPCLRAASCEGATDKEKNATAQCARHGSGSLYRGPLCAACERGSSRALTNYKCTQCFRNSALNVFFVVLLAAAVLVVIAVLVYMTISSEGRESTVEVVILKIAVNHFIIVSAASRFPLEWPGFVLKMMAGMSVVSASAMGDSIFSIDCVSQTWATRPVQSWALATVIAPPCLVAAAGAMWYSLNRCRKNPTYMQIHWPVTNLIMLMLGHPTICKGAFRLVSCRDIAGRLFLERDMEVSCTSAEFYAWALGLALPSLLCLGVGIPTYYLLRMYRLVKTDTLPMHRDVYGFLFSGYEEDCWWFELWNTVRKALIAGTAILLTPERPGIQAWVALVFLMIFILVFEHKQPYRAAWANSLELTALVVDGLTMFMGLALWVNATGDPDAKSYAFALIISVCIVVMNIWFIVHLVRTYRNYIQYGPSTLRSCMKILRKCVRSARGGQPSITLTRPLLSPGERKEESMLNVAYTVDILHQDGDPGEVTVSTKVDEASGEATASTKVDESSGDVAASNTVVERHPVSTMDREQTLEMIPNSVAEAERGAAGADDATRD